ncbi:uncharacterized protein N7473_000260 [Penicillium subrubescens]|uniref:uncharacterized protein n=1 Tax=Penicillium subrubescens TaxID=1316194 RepID=UPI0025457C9B|nr:uncharacterized protein N7473_000260 [Penicillium subrubescens]KAJ5910957.1 hypothetical protein N7473_000260 [Penicillium subrubescens]
MKTTPSLAAYMHAFNQDRFEQKHSLPVLGLPIKFVPRSGMDRLKKATYSQEQTIGNEADDSSRNARKTTAAVWEYVKRPKKRQSKSWVLTRHDWTMTPVRPDQTRRPKVRNRIRGPSKFGSAPNPARESPWSRFGEGSHLLGDARGDAHENSKARVG